MKPATGLDSGGGKEIVQIVVHRQIQFVPIVQPGPLEGSVGDIEPQRTDQMQGTAGDGAGAEIFPVLAGISGSTSTRLIMCVSLFIIV